MRFASRRACSVALAVASLAPTVTEEKYIQEDAKALALKVVELIQSKGLDSARAVLHPEGEFRHGELYVNVINMAGTWLVYPPMPSGEGRSVLGVKDATGKILVREIVRIAQ